jgi:hypothetical protein
MIVDEGEQPDTDYYTAVQAQVQAQFQTTSSRQGQPQRQRHGGGNNNVCMNDASMLPSQQ